MIKDIPIRFLIVAGFLFAGLIPLMGVALLSHSSGRDELNQQAFRHLESVRDIKRNQLERFFEERVRQVDVLSRNPYVVEALDEFKTIARTQGLTKLKGLTNKVFEAPDNYRTVHDRYFSFFEMFARRLEFYDVFLMDAQSGFTLFTVEKENDFGISIAGIDSSLKDVWLVAAQKREIAVSDTRPYAPSKGIPAQFIAAPVMNTKGELAGVVAAQISIDSIDQIMSERSGMGDTGQTYLVGPDYKMRSDSYRDPVQHSVLASFEGSVDDNGVKTVAALRSFNGESSSDVIDDFNGNRVLSAFGPVEFHGVTWAIIAEIEEQEIEGKIDVALGRSTTLIMGLSIVILLILAFGISAIIHWGVQNIVEEIKRLIDKVLEGRLEARGAPERVPFDFRVVIDKINELISSFVRQTEEKSKLEEAVQYNQRLESIGTLAGGIAHDFNNILTYMMSYSHIVYQAIPEDSKARAHMDEINGGIDRAGELVSQIMTFGRQITREKRPIKIALIVKESVKLLKATIPKSIKIQKNIQNEDIYVMSDPTQLHQIVMNLCTNAFHAMQSTGGVMEISLARSTRRNDQLWSVLSVKDSGCGMSAEVQKRVFEPFYTTKPMEQGSGMGLAVVHGIVSALGGEVEIQSEEGRGTEVSIYLPFQNSPLEDELIVRDDTPLMGRGKVLFVDDEPSICRSSTILIESMGYSVSAFTDPREAISKLLKQDESFDVVITDLNMPRLNGVELTQTIVKELPLLPVIMVTGYNEEITEQKAREYGAHSLLLKPYKAQAMSLAIADALTRRSG